MGLMKKIKRLAVDSMIFIYLLDGNPKFVDSIKKRLEGAEEVIFSTFGLAEVLTGFEKTGDLSGKLQFFAFMESYKKMFVIGFGKQEALIFAKLRAKYPQVKAPDAIHLATALSARADAFLTNDSGLKCVEELPIQLL